VSDHGTIDLQCDPERQRFYGTTRYGNLPIDVPFISHIDGNLYQGGSRTGLILPDYFMHLVTLYPEEQYSVDHTLHSSLAVVLRDTLDQGFEEVDDIARWVNTCLRSGPTLVACQAGLNRSGMIVARSLMMRGMTGGGAVELIRRARSRACLCNPSFYRWIVSHDGPGG
jgi:protein-tyrosine phosphatase